MKNLAALIALAFTIATPRILFAQNIDVAVLFSSDTSFSNFEKVQKTAEFQLLANAASADVPGNLSFSFVPLITSVSYNASNKPDEDAVVWMLDQADNPVSPLSLARKMLVAGGTDLVLMITDTWTTTDSCGVALEAPRTIGFHRSETHAFAAVATGLGGVCDRTEISIAHELGHLLYAEHEISGGTDDNGDTILPAIDNHGIRTGGLRSIMYSDINASESTPFFSGTIAGLSSSTANNGRFFSLDSAGTVAAYRPRATAQACTIDIFETCAPGATVPAYQATPQLPGYTVLDTLVQSMPANGSSGWEDLFEGALACIGIDAPVTTYIRALLQTTQGISECQVTFQPGFCEGGGGRGR